MSLLAYWPTPEERDFFEREGYLVVKNALTPEQVKTLTDAVDDCGPGDPNHFYNRLDLLGMDDRFLTLLDIPPVFAKICGFLGWNIWVNHTHYNVRPPDSPDEKYPYHWHHDGGNVGIDLQNQSYRTAIKVAFYLTDLSKPNMGQTWLIPRRHTDKYAELAPYSSPPPESKTINLEAGSAILFQQLMWHSQGSPNFSDISRKTIFIQWAFRWLFPVDTLTLGDLEKRVDDPIKRQMLGFNGDRPSGQLSAHYYPYDSDIPLKEKLIKEVGINRLAEVGPATSRLLLHPKKST